MSQTKGSAGWFPLRLWARTLPVVCLQKKKSFLTYFGCAVSLLLCGLFSSAVSRVTL